MNVESKLLKQLQSDHFKATNFLKEGKLEQAETLYEKILKRDPSFIKAYNNLGIVYRMQGKLALAKQYYSKTIELDPNYFQGYGNLGNIFKMELRFDEAEKAYRKALELSPGFADAHNNLGAILQILGRLEEAAQSYENAIKINPKYMDAYGNLGGVLLLMGKIDQAEVCLRAVENNPNMYESIYNLGNLMKEKGNLKEAITLYKKVLKQKPDYSDALNGLVDCFKQLCEWREGEKIYSILNTLTEEELKKDGRTGETPYTSISRSDDPVRNLKIAKAWSSNIGKKMSSNPGFYFDRLRKTHSKIRIGYLSKDFTDHPIGHIIKTMFASHDKRRFEIYCFSFGGSSNDRFRKKIEKNVKHFVDISSMSYLDAARRIHAEEIDILIDLMGHTSANRLEIFASRPSPVQISYLGFPGSIGADFIDYQIVDRFLVPKGMERYYTERLIYMPDCYQINDSEQQVSRKKFKRSDFGLPKNAFVFCSFNRLFKITPGIFNSWMKILKMVPNSVLWLQSGDLIAQDNLRDEAKKRGINPKRLIFSSMIPLEEHLKRLTLSDLMLDTHVYSGGATTSHSLRMGIPLITLSGKTYLSRMSASLLKAVEMEELIASSFEEYEKIAIDIAKNPKKLKTLKRKLEKNVSKSKLFNTKEFIKILEFSYELAFKLYKTGKRPYSIEFKRSTSKKPM